MIAYHANLARMGILFLGLWTCMGCGTDSDENESDPESIGQLSSCQIPAGVCYEAGMVREGENLSIRLDLADPGPPVRGDQNVWTITVLDIEGEPIDCNLAVSADMPAHGHDTTPAPEASPLQEVGRFEIQPLNLFMPGLWEVAFELECDEISEEIVYPIWIES